MGSRVSLSRKFSDLIYPTSTGDVQIGRGLDSIFYTRAGIQSRGTAKIGSQSSYISPHPSAVIVSVITWSA